MNEITVFESDQFGQVRTVMQDGSPWFVAADVCRALELNDTFKAVERLDDDEKGANLIRTPGGNQEMTVVNEPGLYSLVLGSRKPEAKAFKRWITHEVLPSIRKTGSYSVLSPKDEIARINARTHQARAMMELQGADHLSRTERRKLHASILEVLTGKGAEYWFDAEDEDEDNGYPFGDENFDPTV